MGGPLQTDATSSLSVVLLVALVFPKWSVVLSRHFLAAEPMAGHTRWQGGLEQRWREEQCREQCGAGQAGTWYQTMSAQVCRLVITELCAQKDSAFSPINIRALPTYVDECQRIQRHGH